jgi:hypothetical protein
VVALWGANNQNACFNWFDPDDTSRDRGEALSIRQTIDAMVERHSVDRSRVYIVGLSAGDSPQICEERPLVGSHSILFSSLRAAIQHETSLVQLSLLAAVRRVDESLTSQADDQGARMLRARGIKKTKATAIDKDGHLAACTFQDRVLALS